MGAVGRAMKKVCLSMFVSDPAFLYWHFPVVSQNEFVSNKAEHAKNLPQEACSKGVILHCGPQWRDCPVFLCTFFGFFIGLAVDRVSSVTQCRIT